MNHCAYCNAPILSLTEVCPNCHRKQPPYPPVLPGGGGRSYRGWAGILVGIGVILLIMGLATFFQGPYSNVEALVYGDPTTYIANTAGTAQYLGASPDVPFLGIITGTPIYPGFGYLIFFGGMALILFFRALVSFNRGQRIDKANAAILAQLRNGNGNSR